MRGWSTISMAGGTYAVVVRNLTIAAAVDRMEEE
jgi:hypothetical protein